MFEAGVDRHRRVTEIAHRLHQASVLSLFGLTPQAGIDVLGGKAVERSFVTRDRGEVLGHRVACGWVRRHGVVPPQGVGTAVRVGADEPGGGAPWPP